jgi:hypothetical protein
VVRVLIAGVMIGHRRKYFEVIFGISHHSGETLIYLGRGGQLQDSVQERISKN